MRSKTVVPVVLILLFASAASAQLTSIETWGGSYGVTFQCNGTPINDAGTMYVLLVRKSDGDLFLLSLSDVSVIESDCSVSSKVNVAGGGGVTISGNTITSTENSSLTFTATIDGTNMTGMISEEDLTGSFDLQRMSTEIGPLTGEYAGTYTLGAPCSGGGRAELQGNLAVSLFHGSMRVAGISMYDLPGIDTEGCTAGVFGPLTIPLAGTVTGSSFEGYIGSELFLSFSGTAVDSMLSGTITSQVVTSGESTGTFTLTRTSGAPPPTIESFLASPTVTRPGQPVVLLWSTSNATSVTIDPGLGSQLPDGAVTVTPAATTTYTLSATGESGTATRQVTVAVIDTPEVVLTALPQPMVQGTGAAGATTEFVLTNLGGTASSVSLGRQGDFFTQSPESFTLEPGQSQRVMITGLAQNTGSFHGFSMPSGPGIPSGLVVPVELLSVPAPTGPTAAEPEMVRVDVIGAFGSNPTGTATFRNTGQAKIQGILTSTVPWLIPESGLIEIEPGETVTVSFAIERGNRPANAELGSVEGKLLLVFRSGASGKNAAPRDGAATSSSLVTVVDTSSPPVEEAAIPQLGAGEVALFVPGAGHVQGGSGLFFSDISLINLSGQQTLNNIDLYYTPTTPGASSLKTSLGGLAAGTPVALADVVRTVFGSESTLGSLQIRAPNIGQLAVNANILLRTRDENERTFGNTIPALRSDRSVAAGGSFYLTGLKRTSTSHTNLFIQETSGGVITVDLAYYDEAGTKLGERTGVQVGPFQLVGLFESDANPVLPLGAVSAVITSRGESTGRFAAYATPVDRVSGDSWSLVDWNTQSAFSGDEEMVIPVAGALRGANNLNFRTDVAVINREGTEGSGILRYIPRPEENLPPMDRTITLGAQQSAVLEDVTTTLFGLDPTNFTLGFMKFLPQSGSMTVTSRNFATQGEDPGTFGTGVATEASASSLRLGDVRRIGGIRDSAEDAIGAGVPGTFRSNFGLMETSGVAPVTVRVTVHFSYSTGSLAVSRGTASKEYTLQPNQFIQRSRVSREILGPSRDDYGDFDNLQVDFAVVGGNGAAAMWVSSVENDTGDSILRTR